MVFVQMTVSGAVLILLIVLLRGIALKRLPKSIFPVLWGIALSRLLLPVVIPSAYSIYSLPVWKQAAAGLQSSYEAMQNPVDGENRERAGGPENIEEQKRIGKTENIDERKNTDIRRRGQTEPENIRKEQNSCEQPERFGMEPWRMETLLSVWCAGMSACMLFFVTTYLRALFLFRTSLPVRKAGVERWLLEHKKRRRISVRQSDRVMTPLTYGIFRPVILLPKQTDWQNEEGLAYILLHEYVHICRMDAVTKLLAVSALCVHWFNPFVWVMYVLLNRDMELSCDEKVVRLSGGTQKAAYARVLIDMAARQSGLMPLGSHFGQNVVEERIDAIMKWKKNSFCKKIVSGAVFVGLAVVFTASTLTVKVNAKDDKKIPSGTGFTEEEYVSLLALYGYDNLTVAEYQEKIWETVDTPEYMELLERFSQNQAFYEEKDENEIAAWYFYVLEPLTASKWRERDFGGYVSTDFPAPEENALLEYNITLVVKNPDGLTVEEYDEARKGMMNGLADFLQGKSKTQLRNESFMEEAVLDRIEELKQVWCTDALDILVEYFYMPLTPEEEKTENTAGGQEYLTIDEVYQNAEPEEKEPRINEYAAQEDYDSLFLLRTADYQRMTVVDFDRMLLDWANENFDAYERIREDCYRKERQAALSEEELFFVDTTMTLSAEENYRMVQHLKTGRPEEDPGYISYRLQKTIADGLAWCGFEYAFTYHIFNKNELSVAERDTQVGGVIRDIENLWESTDVEAFLQMTREDVMKKLEEIAAKYSDGRIEITIDKERVYFEEMDERQFT